MIEDGKKYWTAWVDDFGYKKTNNGWLDWWISGEIPDKNNDRAKPADDWLEKYRSDDNGN